MSAPELRTIGIVDVEFGENVTVVQPVNLYGCRIGDESFVGPFVEIQEERLSADAAEFSPTHSFATW